MQLRRIMRSILCAAIFVLCAAGTLPARAIDLVMTAPRVPSAGQPSTILFQAPTYVYDGYITVPPEASVQGSNIQIALNVPCNTDDCSLTRETFFKVDLPALDEGDYQVDVVGFAGDSQSVGEFVFSVGPEAALSPTRPAEGAWTKARRPGTGFYFQSRGPLLSVAQFDYDGLGKWRLDATPMRGDSALVLLREYEGGSCFDCASYNPPSTRIGGTPMLITFDSARRARVELADGTVVPVKSLPFGVDYVADSSVRDNGDMEFGQLALPDISGDWLILGEIISFGPPVITPGQVSFPPVSPSLSEILCQRNQMGEAVCYLFNNFPPAGPRLGTGPPYLAVARMGNVEESRIRMTGINAPNRDEDFFIIRVPSID